MSGPRSGTPAAAAVATPRAEIAIDVALVKRLLQSQHPDLADANLEPAACGWDNAIFRLGEQLCVRLPRREASAALLENEQRWLPELSKRLPLPIPSPVRTGIACANYPWSWSVLPWLSGVTADQSKLLADEGIVLAKFLKALHRPAPPTAPHNPYRGVPLAQRAAVVEERMERLDRSTQSVSNDIRSIWKDALAAPIDVDDTWIHGDLHARNVLVHQQRLSAVIDWGDLCAGDRATDLASIFMWLPNGESRAMAMTKYGGSTATWQRARGWAVLFGLVLLETGLTDNPPHAAMGARILRNLHDGL
ncbi:MAG: aminoglycoside phosphotransferase family protein [Steroidobacteraceae bacterium]